MGLLVLRLRRVIELGRRVAILAPVLFYGDYLAVCCSLAFFVFSSSPEGTLLARLRRVMLLRSITFDLDCDGFRWRRLPRIGAYESGICI